MRYLTDDEVREKIKNKEFNEVIENYMHIAYYIAYKIASRNYNREQKEIYAVAALAVVEGVHRINEHEEPFKFMHKTIKGTLLKFVKRAHLVVIPDYVPDPSFVQYMEEVVGRNEDEEGNETPGQAMNWGFVSEPDNFSFIKDGLVNHKFILPLEKEIILYRLDGYTIEEIAKKIKMAPVAVQRTIERMKDKVCSILDGRL